MVPHAMPSESSPGGGGEHDGPVLVGESAAVNELRKHIERLGPTGVPVLIQGETGTGKELVARLLHRRSGRRGRFVPVNCGAIPGTLFEREVFGHVKGAFTGADGSRPGFVEHAEGGTLVLDEVGELDPPSQVKLLRVLDSGEFSRVGSPEVRRAAFRVVSATNRELAAARDRGGFRSDLYYRLAGVCLRIPPLRARPEDIGPLVRHFAGELECTEETFELLRTYPWPGNVRELRSVLEVARELAGPGPIRPRHLGVTQLAERLASTETHGSPGLSRGAGRPRAGRYVRSGTREEEREELLEALRATRGNKLRAAARLGMGRSTLYRKLDEHRIGDEEWRAEG